MAYIKNIFFKLFYFLVWLYGLINLTNKLKYLSIFSLLVYVIYLYFFLNNNFFILNYDNNNFFIIIEDFVQTHPFIYNIMSRTHLPVNNSVLELDVWDEKTLDIIYTSLAYNINSEGFLEWLKDINMYELKNNKFFSNSIVIFFELNYLDKNNIYYLLEKGYYWDIFINNYTFFTLKTRLVAEIFFINFFSIFLKKKIILFTFFNFFLVILMLYNLYKLYDAINLIYALLHFLYFAILAGLLILLWGSTYLAFCIILIYGAAIPVLALYIIMLVNVDLIQRLFFFEHINKKKISERYKGLLILIFFSIYSIFCFRQINLELIASELPWLQEIYQITTYFSLMKRQFDLSLFSNNYPTIFDLVLSFYSSDLDKVASAAFRTSYNELLALVFLLLIAIIVVISISRPTYLTTKPVFNPILDERHFIWDYVYFMYLARMVFINNLQNVLSFWIKKHVFWTKVNGLTHPTYQKLFMGLDIPDIEPQGTDAELHFDKFATIMAYTTDFKVKDYWTQWHSAFDFESLNQEISEDSEAYFHVDLHKGYNIPVNRTPTNFSNWMLF